MTVRIKSPQDAGAAVLLMVIGLGGLWFGRDYELGSVSQMGPGYMPMLLSIGLLIFGAVIALRAVTVDGPPICSRS
jgi:putative tricarboxylic transport membrane protein